MLVLWSLNREMSTRGVFIGMRPQLEIPPWVTKTFTHLSAVNKYDILLSQRVCSNLFSNLVRDSMTQAYRAEVQRDEMGSPRELGLACNWGTEFETNERSENELRHNTITENIILLLPSKYLLDCSFRLQFLILQFCFVIRSFYWGRSNMFSGSHLIQENIPTASSLNNCFVQLPERYSNFKNIRRRSNIRS